MVITLRLCLAELSVLILCRIQQELYQQFFKEKWGLPSDLHPFSAARIGASDGLPLDSSFP